MAKQPYSPDTRAAVLAAIAAGEPIAAVARQYGIARSTVQNWMASSHVSEYRTPAIQQKKAEIGQQVYGLLEDYIETLRIQVRATRDEDWIKKQSADSLAILHGVLADKSIRLLAAFRPPAQEGSDA